MKMNHETLKALLKSIEHWERVVEDPENEPIGMGKCALCKKFNPNYRGGEAYKETTREAFAVGCVGCPVQAVAGKSFCEGTPYEAVEALDVELSVEDYRLAAQAELDFLISLLPKAGTEDATNQSEKPSC